MRLTIYGSNPWALLFIPHSGYEGYPGLQTHRAPPHQRAKFC